MNRTRHCGAVALALIPALVGCSTVEATWDESFDFAAADTWAWRDTSSHDDLPYAEMRTAIEKELAALAISKDADDSPDLLAEIDLGVELKQQINDPYYSVYLTEKYEEGTLTLRLYSSATGKVVWRGSARHRLRFVSRSMASTPERFVATDEEQDWPVAGMAHNVVQRFGKRR